MGCEVVVSGAGGRELAAIEQLFAERDAIFSRFRQHSELNRVNRAAPEVVVVSEPFALAVAVALEAAAQTDGLVDPTLGQAIVAAGYTRDFADLVPDLTPPELGSPGRWRELRLSGCVLRRPPGVELDLNGVVKGLTVDDAAALLPGNGFVAAGGDLAVRGGAVAGLPGGGAIDVVAGGLATSGTATRRWWRGGELQHHLIDPATARPAESPWRYVTVSGWDCLTADVAAKAAFLRGADGPDWLDERRLPGRFVGTDGAVLENMAWRAALGVAQIEMVEQQSEHSRLAAETGRENGPSASAGLPAVPAADRPFSLGLGHPRKHPDSRSTI
jgi:thiamine biosynthesis lipoprotein ApbE